MDHFHIYINLYYGADLNKQQSDSVVAMVMAMVMAISLLFALFLVVRIFSIKIVFFVILTDLQS